jgi:hypothetical protein
MEPELHFHEFIFLLTFIFVGLIEFWFFTNIVIKYVPLNTSHMYTSFLKSLSKLMKNNL